jgi:hypothetical protein
VLPECQPGIAAYLTCGTQWRTGGLGFRTGLDYAACIRTLDLYLPRWQRDESAIGQPGLFAALGVDDLMEDVMIIESALLVADHERRARDDAQREARP